MFPCSQVRNIANLFHRNPSTVYLMDEIGGLVLFPLDNGKFKLSNVVIGKTYEVHGEEAPSMSASEATPTASRSLGISSPFGAYTSRTCSDIPPPHLPRPKSTKFKKTIMIVSLAKKGKGKERSQCSIRLDYTTVTQVVVSLSVAQCTVMAVAGLVTQQVGFDVILMDSKCYPLLNSEGTAGLDFWKSTRKILAASRSLYEKLTGLSSNDGIIDRAAIDLTVDDGPGPSKRKRPAISDDLEGGIAEKISRMDKRLSFIDELAESFQCVICKSMSSVPVVSPCCQRVIGCHSCTEHWFDSNSRCPLCSSTGRAQERFKLKGFDCALTVLSAFSLDPEKFARARKQSLQLPADSDCSDFEDLPPFNSSTQ